MVGVAIGESMGYQRAGFNRRRALKIFGRPRLRYSVLRGRSYGSHTQQVLLTAQALLNSRSDLRCYRYMFQWRLSWYLLSLPITAGSANLISAGKCWAMRFKKTTGVNSTSATAATRALFSALAVNGTGHRLSRWIEEATKVTHNNPLSIAGCQMLAFLAEYGATARPTFDPLKALQETIDSCTHPDIKQGLCEIRPFLENSRSPSAVARHFGWDRGIPSSIGSVAIMSAYCWLRFPADFRRAVTSAIALGGDTITMAATVGGLVGAHVGYKRLPETLAKRIGGYPHGTVWIEEMAERLSHWPHGVDDLHMAPAQPSELALQLVRSFFSIPRIIVHRSSRWMLLPLRASKPRRLRRSS